jgi:hypothetical protein
VHAAEFSRDGRLDEARIEGALAATGTRPAAVAVRFVW